MTPEQYKEAIEAAYLQHELSINKATRIYADAHNPYKIGDTFKDHIGTIKVEKIGYCRADSFHQLPSCWYEGLELKKDGTPTKRGTIRRAYQINEVKN